MPLGPPGACFLLSLAPWGFLPSDFGKTGNFSQLWTQPVRLPGHLVLGPSSLLWEVGQKMAEILLFPMYLNTSLGIQGWLLSSVQDPCLSLTQHRLASLGDSRYPL